MPDRSTNGRRRRGKGKRHRVTAAMRRVLDERRRREILKYRRYRQRIKAGELVAPTIVNADILDLLIMSRALDERRAGNATEVGKAIIKLLMTIKH
jgi:hypothetical protein